MKCVIAGSNILPMNLYFAIFSILFLSMCQMSEGQSSPKLPDTEGSAKGVIRIESARIIVEKYFQASKDSNAKEAQNYIDYGEWARDQGLEGAEKKNWEAEHRADLQISYDMHKRQGSSKKFKIRSSRKQGEEIIFVVSQERVSGNYIWEVKVMEKLGEWRIKGFKPMKVERGGKVMEIEKPD